jgi:hypothetical protein
VSAGLIDGCAALALVERSSMGGVEVITSGSRLDLVKELIRTGRIGQHFGGICYGDAEHIRALDEIAKHIEAVRHAILLHNAERSES